MPRFKASFFGGRGPARLKSTFCSLVRKTLCNRDIQNRRMTTEPHRFGKPGNRWNRTVQELNRTGYPCL